MNIYKPYTYYLLHIPTGMKYYGVRYAKNSNPLDLWKTYFSSSKRVKKLIEEYGKDSFLYEVRKTFDTAKDALAWEEKVLKRLDVKNNDIWLNQYSLPKNFRNKGGYTQNKETLLKRSGENHYSYRLKLMGFPHPQKYNTKRTKKSKEKYSASKLGEKNPRSQASILFDSFGNKVEEFITKKDLYAYCKANGMPLFAYNKIYNPTKWTNYNNKYRDFVGYIVITTSSCCREVSMDQP